MENSYSETDIKELEALKRFASSSLSKDGIVGKRVLELTTQLSTSMDTYIKARKTTTNPTVELTCEIRYPTHTDTQRITIEARVTLLQLKKIIENQFSLPSLPGFMIEKNGKVISVFDNRGLNQVDIKENDKLIVNFLAPNETMEKNGLTRLASSMIKPSNVFELLVLSLHCFMLDEGFLTVFEQKNATPGFAPSIRELPKDQFVLDYWRDDPTGVTMLYKHPLKSGKHFVLQILRKGDSATVTVSQRKGACYSSEYDFNEFFVNLSTNFADFPSYSSDVSLDLVTDALTKEITNIERMQSRLQVLAHQLIPELIPPLHSFPMKDQNPLNSSSPMETCEPRTQAIPTLNPTSPYPRYPNVGSGVGRGSIGREDKDPFPGLIDPRPSYPTVPMPGGGGNLVGPDHPLFADPYSGGMEGGFGSGFDPYGPFGPPEGLPQPRFDPFGPVTGPNSGVDLGNVGVDGRGRPIPGKAGRGRGLFPGEPNPDHFKPPGW